MKSKSLTVFALLIVVSGVAAANIQFDHSQDIIFQTPTQFNSDVDLSGASLLGFPSNNCPLGEAVGSVNSDGSVNCAQINASGPQNISQVLEEGNIANQTINMDSNKIDNVGSLNVTDTSTNTRIADFQNNGITCHQPISVKSSGPLSATNGIELTDTVANTIESYSTLYLETSSGSPTDIVLNPTGVTGIQSDLSTTGSISTATNTQSGLTDGDINVSQVYHDGLNAKSPVVRCSQGTNWCEVSEPEKNMHYFIKKDSSFDKDRPRETAEKIVENDVDTANKIQELRKENNRQKEKIKELEKTVEGLKAAFCSENPEKNVC